MSAGGAKKMRHLVIATPCYDGKVVREHEIGLIETMAACHAHGIRCTIQSSEGHSLVTVARNVAVHQFLKGDADGMLFIDADVGFRPIDVLALFQSGHDVCGGTYARKMLDGDAIVAAVEAGARGREINRFASALALAAQPYGLVFDEFGFAPVDYLPGGFLYMSRAALLAMCDAYPELAYVGQGHQGIDGESLYALFDCEIKEDADGVRRYFGEDFIFCRRWRRIGGSLMLYSHARLRHVGAHVFEGNVDERLVLGTDAERGWGK